MIKRVQRYVDNLGVLNAVLMLAFVGFFTWRMFQLSNPLSMAIFGGSALFMSLLPLVVMPFFLSRPALAMRFMRVGQYAFYALIANAFLNLVPIPLWAGIVIIMSLYFYVGFGFWFFSSPRIITSQGETKWMDRIERHEESVLRDEIARNDRVIDEQNAG